MTPHTLDEMQRAAEHLADNPKNYKSRRIAGAMLDEIKKAKERERADRERRRRDG